jgi:hypothetical protein
MKKKQVILVLLAVTAVVGFAACDNPWWPHKDMGTLTYDANGGIGTVPAAQTADFRTPIIIASPGGLTKTDHNFSGWNTKKTGDGVNYDTGAALTLSGDITLYANWVQIDPDNPDNSTPGYYYPGGGGGGFYYPGGGAGGGAKGNADPPYTVTYIGGPTIKNIFPNVLHTVEPGPTVTDNKVFMGWKAQQGGPLLAAGNKIQVTADMTFTPVWAAQAVGLFVLTEKNDGSLTASGAAFYASYDPKDEGVKQDITIEATADGVGPFIISDITRSYDVDENPSFDLMYADDTGTISGGAIVYSVVRSRATVTLKQQVTPKLNKGDKVTFRIAPRDQFIPVGTHSLEVSIEDGKGNGATFAMSFVVHPIKLTIKTGEVTYTNPGGALTPIQAPIGGTLYTERTASFSVTVSGFAQKVDANNISLNHLEFDNGVIATVNGLNISHGGGTVDSGTPNGQGVTIFAKTWQVTVALNDTKAFSDGEALAYIGLGGFKQNTANYDNNYYYEGNYYYEYTGNSPGAEFTLIVHDGHAPTTAQAIPVRQQNVAAFNIYANTANGLMRHYKQTENITLPNVAAGDSNWTAIGSWPAFTGSYDGNYKTVTGLVIYDDTWGSYQGMFGSIESATVKNLELVNVSITTDGYYVGGLVGYNDNGTLTGISVTTTGDGTSSIKGRYHTGGVVGYNYYSTLDGFYFTSTGTGTASVTGFGDESSGVGGVVGTNSGTVKNSYSTVNVSSEYRTAGGVVGRNENGTVEKSYSTGDITSADNNAGGVVGHNDGGTVEYCYYTTGTVSSTSGGNAGGIVGNNDGGEVRYCYVTGATITVNVNNAAGVAGQNYDGTVEQCFALGTNVTGLTKGTASNNNVGRQIAGVVGWNSGTVRNCYASGGTVDGSTYTGGVVGRNTRWTAITEYCYSTCVVIGQGTFSTAADFVGGVVGQNYDFGIVRNNVALNPSVTGTYLRYAGRVVGKNSAYAGADPGTTPTNNYARSDMTTANNGFTNPGDVINGDPINAADWLSAPWWTGTVGFDSGVWNIANNGLPTLKNMPGNPMQNPTAPVVP